MKKNLFCKLLTVGIIVLSIGACFVSSANDKNKKIYEETYVNTNSVAFDNFTEFFTKVDAHVYGIKLKGISLLFQIELWGVDKTIDLTGYRYPVFPLRESAFSVSTDYAIIHNFIGRWEQITVDTYAVWGVAIGNIDWS